MQKFSLDDIARLIYILGEQTNKVAEILKKNTNFEAGENSEIYELYEQRKSIINQLNEWISSEEGKNYILGNKQNWDKLIQPIIECDKNNLQLIKERTDELGVQLKNILKQKLLLIYTKEKKL